MFFILSHSHVRRSPSCSSHVCALALLSSAREQSCPNVSAPCLPRCDRSTSFPISLAPRTGARSAFLSSTILNYGPSSSSAISLAPWTRARSAFSSSTIRHYDRSSSSGISLTPWTGPPSAFSSSTIRQHDRSSSSANSTIPNRQVARRFRPPSYFVAI